MTQANEAGERCDVDDGPTLERSVGADKAVISCTFPVSYKLLEGSGT